MPTPDRTPSAATTELVVDAATYDKLMRIGRMLDCTPAAALEEVISEFSLTIQSEAIPNPGNGDLGDDWSPEAAAEVDGSNPSGMAS